ncbi:hypothetical protein DRP07_06960 [Archaeoglobales archaeon]|nr:MAG: hypothetical protein DRP07_06960 [Archaeoglobales archaeon]
MGFRFFRKEKKKEEIGIYELKELLKKELAKHEESLERFAEGNVSSLKEAVSSLLEEIESLDPEILPQRLRGVTKNFISMMKKQWQVSSPQSPRAYFDEVSLKAAKLAVLMAKGFRILFAIKLPEFEGINQRIKEVSAIIAKYEELKRNPSVDRNRQILEKIEELEDLEGLISEKIKKLEELEKLKNDLKNVTEEKSESDELLEYQKMEERLKNRLSLLESELQKKLGVIRKPLRIYAHMVGDKLNIGSYRDLGNESIRRMAKKAHVEIIKGSLAVKESQKGAILKSLEFIGNGEAERVIGEIDSIKKDLTTISAKIKTIESRRRSRFSGEKQRIEKEITSLRNQIESYVERKAELKEDLRELVEDSFPYRLAFD